MHEMIAFAKSKLPPGVSGITLRKNPADAFASQFLSHTRIFIFETPAFSLNIDMAPQCLEAGTLSIVPPLHFHHLEQNGQGNFMCIDIEDSMLHLSFRQLLYAIKYRRQKTFPLCIATGRRDAAAGWDAIERMAFSRCPQPREIEYYLEALLVAAGCTARHSRDEDYTRVAGEFFDLLSHRKLTTDLCKVHFIAYELCHSERTLHRIFVNVFGMGAKSILNYHLAMKGIYLLAAQHRSISDIAEEMNFSSVGVFGRYIKKYTGLTPTAIREAFSLQPVTGLKHSYAIL